jgi:hypothetical protein
MGTRSQGWSALAVALLVVGLGRAAHADARADIQAQAKAAMESYDGMEYDAAKKSLTAALASVKKAKLDKDPIAAKVHLYLGLAAFAAGDSDGAKTAFVTAATIDPKIQIDAAYKSPELVKLLESAKAEAGGGSKPIDVTGDTTDCSSVKGLQHTILDTAKAGNPQSIEVLVGSDLTPVKVAVMYRVQGTSEFVEGKLVKQGGCKYTGSIPAAAMHGSLIHYYVAAYDSSNKVLAGKGSVGSPNIMELTAGGGGAGGGGDTEDPIGGGKQPVKGPGVGVSGGVLAGGKPAKVFVAVAGGTGFGYVTGNTEGGNTVQRCCIGNSLVVLTPELGYYVNAKLSIGIAGRIGLPLGANINAKDATSHSTIAPAALIRIRYGLSGDEGIRVMGQIGGGVMRNTIKLDTQMASDGDTDIVGQGPLLVGGGIGYTKKLGGNVQFIADFSALAGIAVVKEVSSLKVNNGASADLSLGLAIGF